jgi:uncharacterized protein
MAEITVDTDDKDLLRKSPLDSQPTNIVKLIQLKSAKSKQWVASRFNAKITTDKDETILWNSYTGAVNAFTPEHRATLNELLSRDGFTGELNGLAKYLHERGFLVAHATDEYRRFQLQFGQQQYREDILELILLASEDCNFRCIYCYEDFQHGTMLPSVRNKIKKLVENRVEQLKVLNISWFGGEPLYGFEAIEDLAPFFLETAQKHSIVFVSHMTTNGYLLTPEVAEKLLSWQILDYQITIDGMAEQHDKKRPTRNGETTFDVILANLKALKSRTEDFSVTIRINIDRENARHIEQFLTLLKEEFASDQRFKVALHGVSRLGGANDADLSTCGTNEMSNLVKRLQRAVLERNLNLAGTLERASQPGYYVCYAARPYNFIIDSKGDLMKCTVALANKDYNMVGKLSDDGELLLNIDNYALWTEPIFESDKTCQKCQMLPTCQGLHCPLIRFEDNKQPCPSTKLHLRNQLITLLDIKKSRMYRQTTQTD